MSPGQIFKTDVRKSKTRAKPAAGPACVEREPALKPAAAPSATKPPAGGKLALMVSLLQREDGATVVQLAEALGWQTHSVRGAMAGALKARGHVVASQKADGGRVYRLPAALSAEARS